MPERSHLSRVLRAFGRLFRRLTIGLGALILVFYYFGDWILAFWPYLACSEWPKASFGNARGDVAEDRGPMAAPILPSIEERQSAAADLELRYDVRPNQVSAWKKKLPGNAVNARQF